MKLALSDIGVIMLSLAIFLIEFLRYKQETSFPEVSIQNLIHLVENNKHKFNMNIVLTNESKRHYTLNFKLILPSGQELKGLYRESKKHRRKYYAVIKSDYVKEGELLFFDIIFPIGNGEKEGKNIPFALVLYI